MSTVTRSAPAIRKTKRPFRFHSQVPITVPIGRALHVACYARYSTDDQNPNSIDDQFTFGDECVEDFGVSDVKLFRLSDEGISGELVDRPGINQVKEGIARRQFDILIAEDSSRFFRSVGPARLLFEMAVDNDIRVICPNDYLDTANPDWEERLHEASGHHARANRDTSFRIQRAHTGLWQRDAATGGLHPGYLRIASRPATNRTPESGPFFDEVDQQWSGVIREAYERIARGDPTWSVAEFLTGVGLPRPANARSGVWTAKCVIRLIQRTDYRGVQQFRKRVTRKHHQSGRHIQQINNPEDVLERELPHLRIVEDWLWYQSNEVISARNLAPKPAHGREHVLHMVPRDSRGPLSGILFCGVCGAKMYAEGRAQGGYRCSGARGRACWNRATSIRSLTHSRISEAIVQCLRSQDENLEAICQYAQTLAADTSGIEATIRDLERARRDAESASTQLAKALELPGEEVPIVMERLRARQQEIKLLNSQIAQQQGLLADVPTVPTSAELAELLHQVAGQLVDLDPSVAVLLRKLTPNIRAVPYRQFGSDKIVLRAEFDLNTAALLSGRLADVLSGIADVEAAQLVQQRLVVDLFDKPDYVQHAMACMPLFERSNAVTGAQISSALGLSSTQAYRAKNLVQDLLAEGHQDFYIRLEEAPRAASRWRPERRAKNIAATESCSGSA